MSSERWGVGRDVACSVRREHKSYNLTNITKLCSKPLAWLAWVKNFGRCTQRPYFLTAHLPVFLSCWTCFSICPRWCSRNGSLWDPETSSGWHLCTHLSLLTSHLSPLIAHLSQLIPHRSLLISYLSKNKKREFWGEEEKCERFQHSYNQVDTNKWNNFRNHTKKRLKCFWSFT